MTRHATSARSIGLAAALATVMAVAVLAHPQKTPVFKSGVELVVVEASVVDKTGQPVRQLGPDQFEVTLDGKARKVVSADLVGLDSPVASSSSSARSAGPARRVYSDNTEQRGPSSPGRLLIIAFDQSSFRPAGAMAAVASARKFLDRIQAGDRVGFIAFPSPGVEVAPTREHAVIGKALDSVAGSADALSSLSGASKYNVSVSEALDIADRDASQFQYVAARECANGRSAMELQSCRIDVQTTADGIALSVERRSQRSVEGIGDLLAATAGMREHKTLVLVSAGLITSDRPAGRASFAGDLARIGRMAAASNTSIYVLHFDSSFLDAFSVESRSMSQTLFRDSAIASMGLDAIADGAGGTVFSVVAGPELAFERVLRETSAYYLLGVEPADADRDGKTHRIKVAVKMPGVAVRSRSEVLLPPASAEPAAPDQALAGALTAARLSTALPIRATTSTAAPLPGDTFHVLLSADIGMDLSGPVDLRIAYRLTDSTGRSSEPVIETRRVTSRPSGPVGSVSYVAALLLKAGSYVVRMAAVDPAGRLGSVEHRFEVRMTEAPGVAIGELLLADIARGPEDPIAPLSDGRVRAGAVSAYVEAVPARNGSISGVTFGVSDTPDGSPLVTVPGRLTSKDKTRAVAAEARLDSEAAAAGRLLRGGPGH